MVNKSRGIFAIGQVVGQGQFLLTCVIAVKVKNLKFSAGVDFGTVKWSSLFAVWSNGQAAKMKVKIS